MQFSVHSVDERERQKENISKKEEKKKKGESERESEKNLFHNCLYFIFEFYMGFLGRALI